MPHTILLVQASDKESRAFADYDTEMEALEGICQIFEQHLKTTYPSETEIVYDLVQLFEFCDQLTDLSCLVFQRTTHTYAPFNREWIKEKLYVLLREDKDREMAGLPNQPTEQIDIKPNITEIEIN